MQITPGRLTGKQRAFVKHYCGRDIDIHGNATRSYKAAYGTQETRTAAVGGSRLLQHPLIKKLIADATARLDEKIVLNAGFVLEQSKRLYDRAMGDEPVPGPTIITRDPETGSEVVTATERHDYDPTTARHALQMIGQHKSVQAFSVTVEHSHTHRLEQRLAARSKQIEASAGNLGMDPSLTQAAPAQLDPAPGRQGVTIEGKALPVAIEAHTPQAHTDTAHTSKEKRVHKGGGQTERSPAKRKTISGSAGATAK